MIFTPGDYVYSSSKLIDMAPPRLGVEKLSILMDDAGVTFDGLRQAVAALRGFRVHVVGDTIIDSYTQRALIGGQTKTPTMSVLYEGRDDFVGGAAIVAKHLAAAGAKVHFTTVLGDDALKDFVLADLDKAGVKHQAVIDPTRPTTNKNAIVAGGYRLLKIDTVDNRTINDNILRSFIKRVNTVPVDAVVLSDFRHGIFNRHTIPALAGAIPLGCYKVADSQVASRWGNILDFKGFELLTPNEREARFALGEQDLGVRPLAGTLFAAAECKMLILKLSDRGVLATYPRADGSGPDTVGVDSFVEHMVDAVGAGDALLAYATLAMLATKNQVIATILGSMAAACECERDGNIPIAVEDVLKKIDAVERQARYD